MAVVSPQLVNQRLAAGFSSFAPQPCIANQLKVRANRQRATFSNGLLRPYDHHTVEKAVCHGLFVMASGSPDDDDDGSAYDNLTIGSPIMIIEAPPYLKSAEPMPMMRANKGAVMPGDAGRIIGRKPKDVWAVRVKAGAFLIERRYFKPLDME